MNILPVFLTKKTLVELPINTYNCERIILSKLVCHQPADTDINSCTVYFNGTPVRYTRKPHPKKVIFYVDGIPNNIKSFHLLGPCHVKFMIDFHSSNTDQTLQSNLRFQLNLSLEVNSSIRNVC
jgi:hypothetical protein